jgi:lipopolysaccharide/colanic/teichoic acid biosynthesis glycosyltransferase
MAENGVKDSPVGLLHFTSDSSVLLGSVAPTFDVLAVDEPGQPFLETHDTAVSTRSSPSRFAKRTFDVVVGAGMCLLTSLIVLALMLAAVWSFKANPLFVQARIGRRGKRFSVIKVRSLPASAPREADKYQLNAVQTSRFGRFIRSSHIDELPQLWLVVRGRMSLVGPRPDMPSVQDRFSAGHLAARALVRPGCTGLWQVSPATSEMIYEAPEYDLFYAEQMCARLDLWILWHTAMQMLGGATQTLNDVPRWAYAHPGSMGLWRTKLMTSPPTDQLAFTTVE